MNRVFIDALPFFIRPNNTDWKYNFNLSKISEYSPGIEFCYPGISAYAVNENIKYAVNSIKSRAGIPRRVRSIFRELDGRQLRASGCNVIFSHAHYPRNTAGLPVVWQHSVLDPEMQIAFGKTLADIASEIEFKKPAFSAATRVQVSTHSEAVRLAKVYPGLAEKFEYIPFFLPYIKHTAQEQVEKKYSSDAPLKITFVGREARRKGLPALLAALDSLGAANDKTIEIHIVTNFGDGPISLPEWSNLHHHKSLTRAEALSLMKTSHVLAMPSKFEGYGFVFVEAMANGTVILAPHWEVQREIADYGNAGIVCGVDAESIAKSLSDACVSCSNLKKLASAGLARYRAHYAPSVVARRYAEVFASAARSAAGRTR
jgi:glycosyltransferase involved in cell wall biosynthesis